MVKDKFYSEKLSDQNINLIKSSIKNIREDILYNSLKDLLNVTDHDGGNTKVSDSIVQSSLRESPNWIPKGIFTREQNDLIIFHENQNTKITFENYYSHHVTNDIFTENGLLLKGSVITALAGPLIKGEYAQAGSTENLSIGEVSQINGEVKSTGIDGFQKELNLGTQVFQGDVIETFGNGSVGITFIDKTTLSLSDNGRMILDELVFNPSSGEGSMAIDMVEGAFSFISGEIAKTGPGSMEISTPVATVGIRGTTVAGKAAIEGNENSFTLLQDSDGSVGEISISNDGGTQILGQVGATTSLTSFSIPPPPPIILSTAEIQAAYGNALNVLPSTPAIAPEPEPDRSLEEIDEESVSQDDSEEIDEENEEIREEEVSGEEESNDSEEISEDEILDDINEEDSIEEETADIISNEENISTQEQAEDITNEQNSAREAFDTALSSGASPEEAMAAAVESSGLEGNLTSDDEEIILSDDLPMSSQIINPLSQNSSSFASEILPGSFGVSLQPGTQEVFNSDNFVPINSFSSSSFFEQSIIVNPLMSTNYAELYSETSLDYTEPFYFDDPSLYLDEASSDEGYSEETLTLTETGTSGDDTIDKSGTSDQWYLLGNDGNDNLYGGLNNDVIYGGKGKDKMQGSTGNDIFYYKSGDLDGGFDLITDFRQNGELDQLIVSNAPSSGYTRTEIYTDTSVYGSLYNISSNSGNLPNLFNFTETHNTSLVNIASGVESILSGFGIITGDSSSFSQVETIQLTLTDGVDSYFWLWEDDNKTGYIAESELYPVAIALGYENSNMTGNESSYQTISGI